MKVKLIVALLCSLISVSTLAKQRPVSILCPNPGDIHFKLNDPGHAWNRYIQSANAKVISGDYPLFAMSGNGSSDKVGAMTGASFIEGSFICLYNGNNDEILLMYHHLPETFSNCRFVQGDAYECNGDANNCKLVCNK